MPPRDEGVFSDPDEGSDYQPHETVDKVQLETIKRIEEKLDKVLAILGPADRCDKPPTGWKCSRPKGHPGPCSATKDV